MILGSKVTNPTKKQLATAIAQALDLAEPEVSAGSSVDSKFLDRIHKALGHNDSAGPDAYRKTERILQDVGLTYDPFWDTSESQERGGSTVTNRAFSRIKSAVTGTPRCFIFSTTDAPAGSKWETDHKAIYRYNRNVSGHRSLNDAGPGSRVIYYSTSKSTHLPKHFIATAEIEYIAPGWQGPSWEALITGYTDLPFPVPAAQLKMNGWNHQHAITEITWATYHAILQEGGLVGNDVPVLGATDPGAEVTANRINSDFPPEDSLVLNVPDYLPADNALPSIPPVTPTYTESAEHDALTTSDLPSRPSSLENNRRAEQRAVTLTRCALENAGWTLTRDCQKDGIGYDLRFAKGPRKLHVEVKGVQSSTLAFNITPKESWRIQTDPNFIVVVVTSVLSPTKYALHLLTREQLRSFKWVTTGYRLIQANHIL